MAPTPPPQDHPPPFRKHDSLSRAPRALETGAARASGPPSVYPGAQGPVTVPWQRSEPLPSAHRAVSVALPGAKPGAHQPGGKAHASPPPGWKEREPHEREDAAGAAGAEGDAWRSEFGAKTIGFWGSCVLNFNNITGPAVIVLPLLFQQAGWLLPCLGLLLMGACSSFAATMLTESMQRIPHNQRLQHRYEYCTLVQHYFGKRWYFVAQIGFTAGLTASNILAMILTSQVFDSVAAHALGQSYAISYAAWPPTLLASTPSPSASSPPSSAATPLQLGPPSAPQGCFWGALPTDAAALGGAPASCNTSVISLGYLLAMLICVPMGYLNLDANMGFQWASMLAQLLCSLQFAYQLLLRITPGNPAYCPGAGPAHTPLVGPDVSQVVGVCVFAYSYVSTIPSWANEKQPGVSVNKAVWLPSAVGIALNVALGLLGAWAFSLLDPSPQPLAQQQPRPLPGTDNILNLLGGHADPRVFACDAQGGEATGGASAAYGPSPLTQLSMYVWGIGGYVPGIPVLAIMVRYNLQTSGLLGPTAAFLWAVVAPWLFTAFFYQAQILLEFCSWVALLCQGFINLLAPILLYRQALLLYPGEEDHGWRAWRRAQARRGAWLQAALGGRTPAWKGSATAKHSPVHVRTFSEGLEMVPLQGEGWEGEGEGEGEGSEGDRLGARWGNLSSPVVLPREGHGDVFTIRHQQHALHGFLPQRDGAERELQESLPFLEREGSSRSGFHGQSGEGLPDYRTRAVPAWLGADPLPLATSMAVFVFVAISASIVSSLVL